MTTLVYRVQNASGYGVYRVNIDAEYLDETNDYERHPMPEDDAKLAPQWDKISEFSKSYWFFGFSSLEQLKFWFYKKKWRDELVKFGFSVYVFEVDDYQCLIGDTQAVFRRDRATLVKVISFDDIAEPEAEV